LFWTGHVFAWNKRCNNNEAALNHEKFDRRVWNHTAWSPPDDVVE
jgi:hypothetical protein